MSEPFLGEVRAVAFSFAPRGWLPCAGQLLSIAQNTALFSLLGTTFGGNGQTTFALPDYRGRSPVGMGNGPNLSPIVQGQLDGLESVTLGPTQMPSHTHPATATATATTTVTATEAASNAPATLVDPTGAVPAITMTEDDRTQLKSYGAVSATPVQMKAPTVGVAVAVAVQVAVAPNGGGGAPVPLRNPFLGTNFIIATEGIFPSRP